MLDLFDRLGVAAWYTDLEGEVDKCNKTACNLVKKTKKEVLGRDFCNDIVAMEQKEHSTVAVQNAFRGIDTSDLELNVMTQRG